MGYSFLKRLQTLKGFSQIKRQFDVLHWEEFIIMVIKLCKLCIHGVCNCSPQKLYYRFCVQNHKGDPQPLDSLVKIPYWSSPCRWGQVPVSWWSLIGYFGFQVLLLIFPDSTNHNREGPNYNLLFPTNQSGFSGSILFRLAALFVQYPVSMIGLNQAKTVAGRFKREGKGEGRKIVFF